MIKLFLLWWNGAKKHFRPIKVIRNPDGSRTVTSRRLDWMVDHDFWFEKSQRAWIRLGIAREQGDAEAMKISEAQFDWYVRRMKASMPEDVRLKHSEQAKEERRLAIEEMSRDGNC